MAISMLTFLVLATAVVTALFVSSNRILFGLTKSTAKSSSSTVSTEDYSAFISTKDDVLNYYLEKHHKQLGDDFRPYKNHCLRVLAFTKYHLAQDVGMTQLKPHIHNILAMSLAYHDIALWTDGALNYLEPSVEQMHERVSGEMKLSNQAQGDEGTGYVPARMHWSSFEEDADIARAIIMFHHKFTSYDYQSEDVGNASAAKLQHMNAIVNAVRKADWADATMGVIKFGLPQALIEEAYEAIPDEGFHKLLLNMGPRLSPESLWGQFEVMKILKW